MEIRYTDLDEWLGVAFAAQEDGLPVVVDEDPLRRRLGFRLGEDYHVINLYHVKFTPPPNVAKVVEQHKESEIN